MSFFCGLTTPEFMSSVKLPLHFLCVPTEVNSVTKLHMCVCVCVYVCMYVLSGFSHVRLFVTLWTVACQAPLSMGFSRQEYWSGLPCPPPEHLPNPGLEPVSLTSPALVGGFFTTSTIWEAPHLYMVIYKYVCVYVCVCIYIHTYIYIYTHIHIYIYIYICMYHYILIVYFLACLSY